MGHDENHAGKHGIAGADELRNSGPLFEADIAEGTTDISVSPSTFTDIGGLSLTKTIKTGRALVIVTHSSAINSSTDEIHTRIVADAANFRGGSSGRSKMDTPMSSSQTVLVTGLSSGSHTFKAQWKVTGSKTITNNASTSQDDFHRRIIVLEV